MKAPRQDSRVECVLHAVPLRGTALWKPPQRDGGRRDRLYRSCNLRKIL